MSRLMLGNEMYREEKHTTDRKDENRNGRCGKGKK